MLGPREVFENFQRSALSGDLGFIEDRHAEDVVVEFPFARPGMPRRIEGRAEFAAFAKAGRAALQIRFEEFRNVVIHETADPELIIAEYEMVATGPDGRRHSAPFVMVLKVSGGQVVLCREYQNPLALENALGTGKE